jgi:quinol monooxygenase YgiN
VFGVIRHVVFFKFRGDVGASDRDAVLDSLAALSTVVDGIVNFEVGRDFLRLPRSWDAILVSTYADRDSLDAYQRHETHVAVAARLRDLCESIGSVDYPVGSETVTRAG